MKIRNFFSIFFSPAITTEETRGILILPREDCQWLAKCGRMHGERMFEISAKYILTVLLLSFYIHVMKIM